MEKNTLRGFRICTARQIGAIGWSRTRWTELVACLWEKGRGCGFWLGESEGEEKYEDFGVEGRII
jgi:hypothetical protein